MDSSTLEIELLKKTYLSIETMNKTEFHTTNHFSFYVQTSLKHDIRIAIIMIVTYHKCCKPKCIFKEKNSIK